MRRKGKTKEDLLKEMEEVRRSRNELKKGAQERTKAGQKQSKVLEAFFNHNFTPLVVLDKDFNFIRVNEAYAKACQRDVSDFPGHNHFEFYPHEENEAIFRQVIETKKPYQAIAEPFIFPDHPEWGETYRDWTLTPLLEASGEVEFLVFSLRDVPGRTATQHQLVEQAELLDLAHEGILVRDMDGLITYWSRGAEEMYGWTKEEALGKVAYELLQTRFPVPLKEIEACILENHRWSGEIIHTKRGGKEILVDSRWALQRDEHGRPASILGINNDITEQRQIERRTYATNAILNLFSKISVRKEYLDAVVDLLRDWSQFRCVGIRVLDEQGAIPYESYVGFTEAFWESENWLFLDHDQCACIRVVKEKPDPQDRPMMTPAGSFLCSNIADFVDKLSETERARFRGVCPQSGFKSLAAIPIRYRHKVCGTIHLADEREGMVATKTVDFIETMAPLIGEAVQRFTLEAELKRNYETQNTINSLLRLSLEDVPPEEFLEGTLDLLSSNPYFSSDFGGCVFLTEEEKPLLLIMKAHRGLSDRMMQACRQVSFGQCLCGKTALDKKIRFTDCSAAHFETGWAEFNRHAHYHVPILSGQRLLGIINLYLKEGHRPNQEKENFLNAIASTLAGIIIRREDQKALQDSENRLKVLSSQLLMVQENERRHIAREIHDSIGQSLSAIKFTVENILQQIPKGSKKKETGPLRSLIPLIQRSVEESRRIQMDLRPSILDDLGILATISWSCREFQKTYSDIYVEKQMSIQEDEVPDSLKIVIYRIIQESLNNISKYSKAYLVGLSLKKSGGAIELTVQDNGRGFDLSEAFSRDSSRRGMGLGSMRERAELSGGSFEIESIRGKGTTIRVTWKI